MSYGSTDTSGETQLNYYKQMNWKLIQYQTMRAVRQVVRRTSDNRLELHRMRSAFGAGVLPQRVEYADGRLWVGVADKRPGFSFNV